MNVKLTKQYDELSIFNRLQMSFRNGKIHSILGPSGCGKSTLLKCIAGLEPYTGSIDIDASNLSYVFQEDRLFPWFNVFKNLKIINDDQQLIDNYLKRFKLNDLKKKYPTELSGGEKQRISIIRAFIYDKPLILLDEPFKSLDYNLKWDLVNMLQALQKEKHTTVILITHDIDIALYLSDMVYVFSDKPSTIKLQFENINKNDLMNTATIERRLNIMDAL